MVVRAGIFFFVFFFNVVFRVRIFPCNFWSKNFMHSNLHIHSCTDNEQMCLKSNDVTADPEINSGINLLPKMVIACALSLPEMTHHK